MKSATQPVPEQQKTEEQPKPAKYAEAKKPEKHGWIVRGISWCIAFPVIACCLAGVIAALVVCCAICLAFGLVILAITLPIALIRWVFVSVLSVTEIAVFGKHKHICPFSPVYNFAITLKVVLELFACCP